MSGLRFKPFLPLLIILVVVASEAAAIPTTKRLEPLWSRFNDGLIERVVWGEDRLAVVTSANKLFVFSADGKPLWSRRILLSREDGAVVFGPGGRLAVLTSEGRVLVFDGGGQVVSVLGGECGGARCRAMWIGWGGGLGVLYGVEWVKDGYMMVNYTLVVYGLDGERLWSRVLGSTRGYYWPPPFRTVWCGGGVAVAGGGALQFLVNGSVAWSEELAEEDVKVGCDGAGHVAVYAEHVGPHGGVEGVIATYDAGGGRLGTIEGVSEYALCPGRVAVLAGSELKMYDIGGRLLWSVSEPRGGFFSDVKCGGDGRVAVFWWGEERSKVESSSESFSIMGLGVKVFENGREVRDISDWNAAWSPGGLLATWHLSRVRVYSRSYGVVWEREFLDSMRRVSWSSGGDVLCVVPVHLRGPHEHGEPLFFTREGEAVEPPDFGFTPMDAFYSGGFLVATGYTDTATYVAVYSEGLEKVFSREFPGAKERRVPVAAVSPGGVLALGLPGSNRVYFYRLKDGAEMGEAALPVGEDGLKDFWWLNGSLLAYRWESGLGVIDVKGRNIVRVSPGGFSRHGDGVELLGDGRIAVLFGGRLAVYSGRGEKVWERKGYVSLFTVHNGTLIVYTGSRVIALDENFDAAWERHVGPRVEFLGWVGDVLVVGFANGTALLMDGEGRLLYTLDTGSEIVDAAWSDGGYMAFATKGGVYVYRYVEPPRSVRLVVEVPGGEFYVLVDGERHAGPRVELEVAPGTHNVTVPGLIAGRGYRYRFAGWSDGVKSSSRLVEAEGDVYLRAVYVTEYYVGVSSRYGRVSGGGWYRAGEEAVVSVSDTVVDHGNGTRRVFKGWSNGSAEKVLRFTVSKPVNVTALWDTEYRVEAVSSHGNVSGGGWYPRGSVAVLEVERTEVEEGGKRYVFDGWYMGGKLVSHEERVELRVDGPLRVEARWREASAGGAVASPLIGVVVIAAVAAALYLVLRRRAGRRR